MRPEIMTQQLHTPVWFQALLFLLHFCVGLSSEAGLTICKAKATGFSSSGEVVLLHSCNRCVLVRGSATSIEKLQVMAHSFGLGARASLSDRAI